MASDGSRWTLIHRSASSTVLVRSDLGLEHVEPRRAARRVRIGRRGSSCAHGDGRKSVAPPGPGSSTPSRGEVGDVGEQHRLARATDLVDTELAADDVGAHLRHPAQRGALAAGDRDEPLGAALRRVVDRLERPGQLAAGVGLAPRADQRSRGRPGGAMRRRGDRRDQLRALRRPSARRGPRGRRGPRDPRRPTSWCRRSRAPRCGTTMSPSPDACRRLITMLHSRPRSASITPGEGRIGTSTPAMARHLLRPRARRVHGEVRMDLGVAAGDVIVDGRAAHHAVVHQEPGHLHVVQQRRAVPLRGREEPQRHPHRVHRGVGHAHGGLQRRGSASAPGEGPARA